MINHQRNNLHHQRKKTAFFLLTGAPDKGEHNVDVWDLAGGKREQILSDGGESTTTHMFLADWTPALATHIKVLRAV